MTSRVTHHQRMPSGDAAWLHMDRPTNLMVINALWLFDQTIDRGRLREVIERRLLAGYPRFRQRAVEGRLPIVGTAWEDDPGFDLDHHLHRRGLAAPADQNALQALVGDLMASPLDHAKPLWDMYLIDGPATGCALFIRMHHCIADGISLAGVMLSLTDSEPNGAAEPLDPPRPARAGLLTTLAAPAGGALALASTLAHEGVETLVHPRRLTMLGRNGAREASALVRLLSLPPDANSSLRGELGTSRRVAWTSPLDLEVIKHIAHDQEATVNDVLLAAVSGALRRHLLSRGEAAPSLRAIVPFNLRPPGRAIPRELGNHFGLVFLDLPVNIPSRRQRLRAVKQRDGCDQAVTRRAADLRGTAGYGSRAGRGRDSRHRSVLVEGHRGRDQRPRPARRGLPRRYACPGRAGVGADIRHRRHEREHPQLPG